MLRVDSTPPSGGTRSLRYGFGTIWHCITKESSPTRGLVYYELLESFSMFVWLLRALPCRMLVCLYPPLATDVRSNEAVWRIFVPIFFFWAVDPMVWAEHRGRRVEVIFVSAAQLKKCKNNGWDFWESAASKSRNVRAGFIVLENSLIQSNKYFIKRYFLTVLIEFKDYIIVHWIEFYKNGMMEYQRRVTTYKLNKIIFIYVIF